VNADPKRNTTIGRLLSFVGRDRALEFSRAPKSVKRAFEHGNETVTGVFDNLATVKNNRRVAYTHAQTPIARMGLKLGSFHEAGVANHICHKNGSEAPLELRKRFN
jgi:hypothetical protein